MGVQVDPSWWTTGVWDGRPLREFLQRRDIPAVFRFVHARGVSYGTLAALVGISPNRAAEIARGMRQVTAYEVLERIAVGLHIPRAVMGLGCDQTDLFGPEVHDIALPHRDRRVSGSSDRPTSGETTNRIVSDSIEQQRIDLDEALSSSTVSLQQLQLIEESTAEHVQEYPSSSPNVMLARLVDECVEVTILSRRRQPAKVQARLSGSAALLSTMCADALMRLGDASEARMWYRTAISAADDSMQTELSVLVRAHAAMLPYYFGDVRQTVTMADAALAVTAAPSAAAALAAAGRARALARLGVDGEARGAMAQARRLFDDGGDADSNAAFRFPEKRLLFYLSGALTWLRDTEAAYRVQDEALRLYGPSPAVPIDPALIRMDGAMCLMHDRRFGEAGALAQRALVELPEAQRTEIVLTRASAVVAAAPPQLRVKEVTALADYVRTCRERARTLAVDSAALNR